MGGFLKIILPVVMMITGVSGLAAQEINDPKFIVLRTSVRNASETSAARGLEVFPANIEHALGVRRISLRDAAKIPGDWRGCLVYAMRVPRATSVGVPTQAGGNYFMIRHQDVPREKSGRTSTKPGYGYVAEDARQCPPDWYTDGTRVGKNKLLVEDKLYTVNLRGRKLLIQWLASSTVADILAGKIAGLEPLPKYKDPVTGPLDESAD